MIAVVGPGTPDDDSLLALAERCGRLLAEAGATVVTGGLGGVMEAAGRGARSAGGRAIAIVPGTDARTADAPADVVVATGVGEARDLAVVASSDAVLAVGGGWGTLAEIALARKLGRPVVRLRSWGISCPPGGDDEVGPEVGTPEEAVRRALAGADGDIPVSEGDLLILGGDPLGPKDLKVPEGTPPPGTAT
jgi:uncharacterized protein (TIGR00725 family)